jgi:hypothetical protein
MNPIIIESVESENETSLNSPLLSDKSTNSFEDFMRNDGDEDYSRRNTPVRLTLQKIYQMGKSVNSSINTGIYAATGIQLNQKRLVVSFIFTLIKDFSLAYTVRGSLKCIPKLLKMMQLLK